MTENCKNHVLKIPTVQIKTIENNGNLTEVTLELEKALPYIMDFLGGSGVNLCQHHPGLIPTGATGKVEILQKEIDLLKDRLDAIASLAIPGGKICSTVETTSEPIVDIDEFLKNYQVTTKYDPASEGLVAKHRATIDPGKPVKIKPEEKPGEKPEEIKSARSMSPKVREAWGLGLRKEIITMINDISRKHGIHVHDIWKALYSAIEERGYSLHPDKLRAAKMPSKLKYIDQHLGIIAMAHQIMINMKNEGQVYYETNAFT